LAVVFFGAGFLTLLFAGMGQVKPARNDQGLLGAIFVIIREEDRVPDHAQAAPALKYERRSAAERSKGKEAAEAEWFHGLRSGSRANERADIQICWTTR